MNMDDFIKQDVAGGRTLSSPPMTQQNNINKTPPAVNPYTPPKQSGGLFSQLARAGGAMKSTFSMGLGAAKGVMSNPYESAGLGNWLGGQIGKAPLVPGVLNVGQATEGAMKAGVGAAEAILPGSKEAIGSFARGGQKALEVAAQKPQALEPENVGEEIGFGLEKAGEFFLTPGFGAEKSASLAPRVAARYGKNLGIAAKQQGEVTPETAIQAGISSVMPETGKIPQALASGQQMVSGGVNLLEGNTSQGVVDLALGSLGAKSAWKEKGLVKSNAYKPQEQIRQEALKQYESHLKPVTREIREQHRQEVMSERFGGDKRRPVAEVLFDERIPLRAESDGQSLRYSTAPEQVELNSRIDSLQRQKQKLLSSPAQKHDLESIKQESLESLPKGKTPKETSQMKKEIAEEWDAAIEEYGRNVTDAQLDELKMRFGNAGDWKTMTPAQAHMRKLQNLLKTKLENANPEDAQLKKLNEMQGDLLHARGYLQEIDATPVRGGILGKKLAQIGGAIAGRALPIPVAGELAGAYVGGKLQEMSIDPNRGTGKAIKGQGFMPKSAQTVLESSSVAGQKPLSSQMAQSRETSERLAQQSKKQEQLALASRQQKLDRLKEIENKKLELLKKMNEEKIKQLQKTQELKLKHQQDLKTLRQKTGKK